LRYQFEVSVVGQVALSQMMLPLLRASRGRLVFVGSSNGRFAGAPLAPYAATKHAIEAIAASLTVELRGSQVRVVRVEPASEVEVGHSLAPTRRNVETGRSRCYSAIASPEPPKSSGKSLSLGRPSFMRSTVDS
jgi:NAD(P)-dependent dehydrogenase (short-subunit alcohol dehydrogenase family)